MSRGGEVETEGISQGGHSSSRQTVLPQMTVNGSRVAPGRYALIRSLRLIFSFPSLLVVMLLTVIFAVAHKGMADPDIWWHLRNAQYLMQHGQLPRYDLYSFTVAGHPWINHEWLAEIPYYLAWRSGGFLGLKILELVLLSSIFMGLLYLCYRASSNFKAAVLASSFAVLLASVSFGPRTILFGYLFAVILLLVLQRFQQQGRGPLWLLPPLFCIWANTHGSWSLGIILFAIVFAAGLFKGKWGRVEAVPWSKAQLGKLTVTGAASVAALFVNPFGYHLVLYPLDLAFRQKLNISHVAEWISVNFHDLRGKLVLLLILSLLVSALFRGSRWTLAELFLVLFGMYSGLTYIRFLFLLAIVAAPAVAKMLDFVPPYNRAIDKPVLNALLIVAMIAGLIHYRPTSTGLQHAVEQTYPAGAVAFLKSHPPDGPLLNFYLWGGYLIWNDRDVKVFVDSRVDIFEYGGVLQDYLDLLDLNQPERILDKYHIRYVLFPAGESLSYVLQHDNRWKVNYHDQQSILFER